MREDLIRSEKMHFERKWGAMTPTFFIKSEEDVIECTLKKILYLNPPKHELLNHLWIQWLNPNGSEESAFSTCQLNNTIAVIL